jgi:hypothetical protein
MHPQTTPHPLCPAQPDLLDEWAARQPVRELGLMDLVILDELLAQSAGTLRPGGGD